MRCMKPLQKFFSSNDVISVVHFSQTYITGFNCCKLDHTFTSSVKHNEVLMCSRIGSLDSSVHLLVVTEIA